MQKPLANKIIFMDFLKKKYVDKPDLANKLMQSLCLDKIIVS